MNPVSVIPVQKSPIIDIDSSMSSSDNNMAVFGSSKGESMEQDTGDSEGTGRVSKVCLNQHRLDLCSSCKLPSLPAVGPFTLQL